ncbi:VIT family-domain-containing protein [Suillus subalutaceus]|uniref:VIT family-domain-containing protein n=1 Tax=Suillus subalutaceus TaxID=48586 RepID=UPI001B8720E7|nr:VIT family-domain-containing protein [Suillus subalutaceus]KAG1872951.1 VIT family-domain-containing protein [Suillus subalutaceus]
MTSTHQVSTSTAVTTVVPLPVNRDAISSSSVNKQPPVWSLDSNGTSTPPLTEKCDRLGRQDGVCCKELKGEDDRTLIDPDVVRDIIIGLSDGLTVPFALTAGLSGLGSSRLVVVGGLAELIAGAISMGIGGFLASQAERDHYRFMRRHTYSRVMRSCIGEMEREVYTVLGSVGVDESASQAVANCLWKIEDEPGFDGRTPAPADEEKPSQGMKSQHGLTPFLLKFGEGMEEIPNRRLYISAFTIGMGYLLGGIIPLLPYFFLSQAIDALKISCIITGIVLLIFGTVKARVTGAARNIWGYIWGAVSTMAVGGFAAAAAYGLVIAVEGSSIS